MKPKTYATAAAFKKALEDRVRTHATTTGVSINRFRQVLIFDRILGRLAAAFGDDVLAKGGVVLELRLERARTTRDVDVRLAGGPPERLLERLQEAGARDLGDGLTFLVRDAPEGAGTIDGDGVVYEGQRFRAEARLAGALYGMPFGVDVALGDALTGPIDAVEGAALFDFVGAPRSRIRLYPRETHVAEKLHAFTLPRASENSRVKDLPDIALLAQSGPYEAAGLREALERTFAFRRSHPLPQALPAPPVSWDRPYEAMASDNGLRWASLREVTDAAAAFLTPVLAGAALGRRWNPERWRWEP